jgi:hypothetical protein
LSLFLSKQAQNGRDLKGWFGADSLKTALKRFRPHIAGEKRIGTRFPLKVDAFLEHQRSQEVKAISSSEHDTGSQNTSQRPEDLQVSLP